jgi:protein disulfide-isomerase
MVIAFGLLVTALAAWADEKLPVLKVGDNLYTNVTVTKVTATDIYFTYAGGMGNAKLRNLEPELQERFHFDPARASEAEQKHARDNVQYHTYIINQPTPKPPADDDESPPPAAARGSESSWGTDLPAALNRARSENKLVLIDFTGSDWCGWCSKFDHDVLSTDKFAGYARNRLVLVKLDFPRHHPQDAALKQANAQLAQRFGVDGFPTLVLLNSAGKELGRQVGYIKGGPDAFITELERFSRR